jgi:hypothetical protein
MKSLNLHSAKEYDKMISTVSSMNLNDGPSMEFVNSPKATSYLGSESNNLLFNKL